DGVAEGVGADFGAVGDVADGAVGVGRRAAVGGLSGDQHRGRVEGAVGVGVVGQHRDGGGGALGDRAGVVDRDRGVVDRGDGEGHGGGVADRAGVVLDG